MKMSCRHLRVNELRTEHARQSSNSAVRNCHSKQGEGICTTTFC